MRIGGVNRLRVKILFMILPLVILVVLVSGVLATLESRAALIRTVNRHLAYKAEQLRDYVYSEWGVIENLGLTDQVEYQLAAAESFRSYAYSLLRSETEEILALDHDGVLIHRIALIREPGDHSQLVLPRIVLPTGGWFSARIQGEDRVGVTFGFEPLGWTVAITELQSQLFSDLQDILTIHLWILAAAVAVVTVLTTLYTRHILGPVERLAGTLANITLTGDLSRRVVVESSDEIGVLAHRFNLMISSVQDSEAETLFLLGRVSDFRDEQTGAHQDRIGGFSVLFSRLLGLDAGFQHLIRNAAPLHDIGKIGISDQLLLKPGKLTKDEFEVIKTHTVLGYNLLKDSRNKVLIEGASIALNHHERWDGSGYPNGLIGEAIPLSSRIVTIVDVFDALTSDRPYKSAWSAERAYEYIVSQKGKLFDPLLIDVFEKHFSEFASLGLRSGSDA